MSVLCTFPGKFGDLLWALPTVRALARRLGEAIDLEIAAPFGSILSMLEQQPYIGHVCANAGWVTQNTAPISPRIPPAVLGTGYQRVYHLGYRGWPQRALPYETLDCLNSQWEGTYPFEDWELTLREPWIVLGTPLGQREGLAVGFTDEHFELKYGVTELLRRHFGTRLLHVGGNDRWVLEAGRARLPWERSAQLIRNAVAFLGCCSALHVLAVAAGTPVVLLEPNPHRHHPIFYPLGQTGPEVLLVKGIDHQPTFDARHVRAAVEALLERTPAWVPIQPSSEESTP